MRGSEFQTRILIKGGLKVFKVIVILGRHVVGVGVPDGVVFGVDIEALGVSGVADGGDDGARVVAVIDAIPINTVEKGVALHLGCATANVA